MNLLKPVDNTRLLKQSVSVQEQSLSSEDTEDLNVKATKMALAEQQVLSELKPEQQVQIDLNSRIRALEDEILSGNEGILRDDLSLANDISRKRIFQERLSSMVYDPETSEDQVAEFINVVSNARTNPESVVENKVADFFTELGIQDSDTSLLEEAEPVDYSGIHRHYLAHQALQEELLKAGEVFKDQGLVAKTRDVAGLFIPFYEILGRASSPADALKQIRGRSISNQATDLYSSLTQFDNIEDMRNYLDSNRKDIEAGVFGKNALQSLQVVLEANSAGLSQSGERAFTGFNLLDIIPTALSAATTAGRLADTSTLLKVSGARNAASNVIANAVKDDLVDVANLDDVVSSVAPLKQAEAASSVSLVKKSLGINPAETIDDAVLSSVSPNVARQLEEQQNFINQSVEIQRIDRLNEAQKTQAIEIALGRRQQELDLDTKLINSFDILGGEIYRVDPLTGDLQVDALLGTLKGKGKGFVSPETAKRAAENVYGLKPGEYSIESSQGPHFIKVTVDVGENSFPIRALGSVPKDKLAKVSPYLNVLASPDLFLNTVQKNTGHMATSIQGKMQETAARLAKSLKVGNKKVDEAVTALVTHSQETGKWLKPQELSSVVGPDRVNDTVVSNYYTLQQINDVDYAFRNAFFRSELHRNNYKSLSWEDNTFIGRFRLDVGEVANKEIVFDTSKGSLFEPGDLDPTEFKNYMDKNNLVAVQPRFSDDLSSFGVTLETGNRLDPTVVVVPRSALQSHTLPQFILNYQPGGHRLYQGRYFLKQGRVATGRTNKQYLMKPRTFYNFESLKEGRDFADNLEAARLAYLDEDISKVDELLDGTAMEGFDNFDKLVRQDKINPNIPFELLEDGERPSFYTNSTFRQEFLNDSESDLVDYFYFNGNGFLQKRGEHLTDAQGAPAAVVNPYLSADRGLKNALNLGSFANYKIRAADTFFETFKDILDPALVNEVNQGRRNTIQVIMNPAYNTETTNPATVLRRQAQAHATAYQRLVNQPTVEDNIFTELRRTFTNYVYDKGKVGEYIQKEMDSLSVNPVEAARSMVFDTSLGLFDISQLPVQTSTVAVISSLRPQEALRSMSLYFPLRAILINNDPKFLKHMATQLKKAKFIESAEDFVEMGELLQSTGFANISKTLTLVDQTKGRQLRVNKFLSGTNAVREAGRVPFLEAERLNRLVGFSAEYFFRKKKNLLDVNNPDSVADFVTAADELTVNMTRASASNFQSGALSIPTQFLSYNLRLAELLLSQTLDTGAKARLLVGQAALYGSAGMLGMSAIGTATDNFAQYISSKTSLSLEEAGAKANEILDEGVLDAVILESLGFDSDAASRLGSSLFNGELISSIHNSPVNPLETALGPTYSKATSLVGAINNYMLALNQTYHTGDLPSVEDYKQFGRLASSFSRFEKAYILYKTNKLISSNGSVLYSRASGDQEIFLTAMGFQLDDVSEAFDLAEAFDENFGDSVKTSGKLSNLVDSYARASFDFINSDDEAKRIAASNRMKFINTLFQDDPLTFVEFRKQVDLRTKQEGFAERMETKMLQRLTEDNPIRRRIEADERDND